MSPAAPPIVVIGGGLVGLCCGLQLQRLGREVLIVDPGKPEGAASYGNAGQLAGAEVVPVTGPGVLLSVPRWLMDPLGPLAIRWQYLPRLAPWLLRFLRAGTLRRATEISRSMASLCDRIYFDYQPLLDAAGVADIVQHGPHLRIYNSKAQWEAEGWRWDLRLLNDRVFDYLDQPALHALEPDLSPGATFAAAAPDRYFVRSPPRLMQAFGAHFVASGGRMVAGSVTGFDRTADAVTAVRLASGERYEASQVVVAAGAWSHRLTAELGDRVPLETERGYHVMLASPGVTVHHSLTYAPRGFAITPMEQGLRLAGTVEFGGLKSAPNWARARKLIEAAKELLPGLKADDPQFWMGHRPSMPDSLPVIDRASKLSNVFYAFGHGHMGLSWAATTGLLIAALSQNQPTNFDVTPFRLGRFRAG